MLCVCVCIACWAKELKFYLLSYCKGIFHPLFHAEGRCGTELQFCLSQTYFAKLLAMFPSCLSQFFFSPFFLVLLQFTLSSLEKIVIQMLNFQMACIGTFIWICNLFKLEEQAKGYIVVFQEIAF